VDVAAIDELLADVLTPSQVVRGDDAADDYQRDEAITGIAQVPAAVVFPTSTEEVSAILRVASEHRIPVTARGSGTGLSGAAIPVAGGVVVSFERMTSVLEIDEANHVVVVQPGVTLVQLDAELAARGLVYPVYPGEYSASLGGNVATNAGGMRAVKYGVTRHQVLGLEAVLPGGEVIRTGGRYVKSSSGYDLTQLVIGSEGTLALVTEATLRVYPRPAHQATVMAPFATLEQVMDAVPKVVASGIGPLILEYIDMITMAAMSAHVGMDLGVPEDVKASALAYLVVMMEDHHEDRLDADVQALAEQLSDLGAMDVYVLPPAAALQLIDAREKAFWVAKANGADDIVDVVVPRAAIAPFMEQVAGLAERSGSWIAGCGHAGDGNVHLSIFQGDAGKRSATMKELFEIGMSLGGAISGEHGIGTAKRSYFLDLEDPVKVQLMRRIKTAFDPAGILNPGTIFDDHDHDDDPQEDLT
jgi:glycolate oxidase